MKNFSRLLFISSILLGISCYGCSSNQNVSSIEVIAPETTEFLKAFDESSVALVVTYENQKQKTYTYNDLEFDYSQFNNKEIGNHNIGIKVKDKDISSNISVEVVPSKSFSLLMIGNSFSDDTIQWVYEICDDLNIEVNLANLYIPGCSLDTHYNNLTKGTKAYEYRTYVKSSKTWKTTNNYSIQKAFNDYDWDFISLQQASGFSGQPSSYSLLNSIVEKIKNKRPNVNFVWNMTWAYQQNSTHSDFAKYNKNQLTMYNSIVSAVKEKVLSIPEIDVVVPNGTSIQNARTSYIGDNLTRDGYHLSFDYGRYIAGLTLVKTMTGTDISKINYAPNGVSNDNKKIAIESVTNAIKNPFEITNSIYTQEPSIDLSNYIEIDYLPVASAYYNSTDTGKYNQLITTEANSMNFIASKKFTKEELPIGSIIEVKSGYQYRPEGWIDDNVQSSRQNNVSTRYVEVTDAWWGKYKIRAFNISKTNGASLMNDFKQVAEAFSIYVPKDKYNADTYDYFTYDDTDLFKNNSLDINNYEQYKYAYSNGFYDSSNNLSSKIIFTDTGLSNKFICTESFTKENLPNGTILIVDNGYQYRPDAWVGDNTNSNRPGNVTTNFVVINDNCWSNYTIRGFNISKLNTPVINQTPHEVASHFRIYIPKVN